MRSIDGQRSDNQPIRRTPEQKKRLLAELRQTLAGMKPHVAPALRASISGKIVELEVELGLRKA